MKTKEKLSPKEFMDSYINDIGAGHFSDLNKEEVFTAMVAYHKHQKEADQETAKLREEMEEYREKYTCNQHTVINQQSTITHLQSSLQAAEDELETTKGLFNKSIKKISELEKENNDLRKVLEMWHDHKNILAIDFKRKYTTSVMEDAYKTRILPEVKRLLNIK